MLSESTSEYLALQSWLHLRHGRTAEAIILLEGFLACDAGNEWGKRTLSYAYLLNGDFQLCLDLQNRNRTSKLTADDRLIRLRALWGLGRHTEARQLRNEMNGRLRDNS